MLNDFVFNANFYLQIIWHCVLGTIYAPAYANFFYGWIWTKIQSSFERSKMNSFFTRYWWYIYGVNQIWKKAARFYQRIDWKTLLYKFCLQIWLQGNRVYTHQQIKLRTSILWKSSDRQIFLNAKLEHPYPLM